MNVILYNYISILQRIYRIIYTLTVCIIYLSYARITANVKTIFFQFLVQLKSTKISYICYINQMKIIVLFE